MDKTTDLNAYYKTKASSILNDLSKLPNTSLCYMPLLGGSAQILHNCSALVRFKMTLIHCGSGLSLDDSCCESNRFNILV